jgi:hypothetical protein
MDYKLVATADIEHLNQGQAAHQFHAAQILLEEEHVRHTARVKELEDFIREVRPRVHPGDLHPRAAEKIRGVVSGQHPAEKPADVAKNPNAGGTASPAS